MPLIQKSSYHPAWPFTSAHVATTLPTLLRRVALGPARRERLELDDGDFLDLDCWWQEVPESPGTVVLLHGLEGSSRRQYMLGMARAFLRCGWCVVAVNFRGCSGEPNRLPLAYHSGATADLRAVLAAVDRPGRPVRAVVGFSLGGNLLLKYLGEDPQAVLPSLQAAVAFSAPTDLAAGERKLRLRSNRSYLRRFLRKLSVKVRHKAGQFPGEVDPTHLKKVRWLYDFDDHYTAPWGGFNGADEYYRLCSSRRYLPDIQLPSLLVSARNDPFLAWECYPLEEAQDSDHFHLEMPDHGGHVGFRQPGPEYWSELRALQFIHQNLA